MVRLPLLAAPVAVAVVVVVAAAADDDLLSACVRTFDGAEVGSLVRDEGGVRDSEREKVGVIARISPPATTVTKSPTHRSLHPHDIQPVRVCEYVA
jgi:hypothetical protein